MQSNETVEECFFLNSRMSTSKQAQFFKMFTPCSLEGSQTSYLRHSLPVLNILWTREHSFCFRFKNLFMLMNVLPACVPVSHVCAWCLWRSEEGIGSPETGVTDDCEPPYPGPLEELQVLLMGEPSLQMPCFCLLNAVVSLFSGLVDRKLASL